MKFIELTNVFDGQTIYINVESIVVLAPIDCMLYGKQTVCCNVTYNIGSSVSSVTIAKTCQEVIDTIIKYDLINFKGTIYKIPPFSKEYLNSLQNLREQLEIKPSPKEPPQCNGNGTAQKTEE